MKKGNLLLIFLILISLSFASAKTLIAGKVYNYDFSKTVSNATVIVNCNNHLKTTTSLRDGSYAVIYLETGPESCKFGDNLTVFASHPEEGNGTVSGTINKDVIGSWDISITNIAIPEFTTTIAMLTMLVALLVFFIVRRN